MSLAQIASDPWIGIGILVIAIGLIHDLWTNPDTRGW